jgi:hypothetical protein
VLAPLRAGTRVTAAAVLMAGWVGLLWVLLAGLASNVGWVQLRRARR